MTSFDAALVTGGARRLGRAIVLALAKRGISVAIHSSTGGAEADLLAEEVRALGVDAAVITADFLDAAQLDTLVDRTAAALGRPLDVLINNASIFEYDTLDSATQTSWDRHMDSNLRAPLFLTQAFARQAPSGERDAGGRPVAQAAVINMVDQRVRKLTPEFMTYTLAKTGLWTLTQTSAQALAPWIRVNAIGPGPTIQGTRQSAAHFARQRENTLLQRGSDPQDVVAAMHSLLDNPAMTGQLLCVDGGQSLGWQTRDIIGVEPPSGADNS